MKSLRYIIEIFIENMPKVFGYFSMPIKTFVFTGILFLLPLTSYSQSISIVAPIKNAQSVRVADSLSSSLSKEFVIVDDSLTNKLFDAENFGRPFNLSIGESKAFCARAGCNFFLLVRADTIRRTSFEKAKYFESFGVFYLVSARTGNLIYWNLSRFEKPSPEEARKELFDSLNKTAKLLRNEIEKAENVAVEDSIDNSSGDGIDEFRPPMPYRRIKPKYTDIAALYDVLATVDIEVSIDKTGKISRTEIVRWAGFGLDESVIETVKKMKWRPADQNGKTMAKRVLLRYNFRNIDTDK